MGRFRILLSLIILRGSFSDDAFGVLPKTYIHEAMPFLHVAPDAIAKAKLELKFRKLRETLQNQNTSGQQIDQLLERMNEIQRELRGERW